MKRKLIQLSPSTMVISLPSKWVVKNNLEKGAEIELQESENALFVNTVTKKIHKSISVNIKELSEKLSFAYIDAAYIAGYTHIEILHTKEQGYIFQYVAQEVPGMIIQEQTATKTIFTDITGVFQEDIGKIITRIFHMLLSLIDDARDAAEKKEWETLRKVKKKDYILNSYVSYCMRIINKNGYNTFSKTGLIVSFLKLLEMCSDILCQIARDAAKEKKQVHKELSSVYELFSDFYRLHKKHAQKAVVEFEEKRMGLKSNKISLNEIKSLLFDLLEVEIQLQS